MNKLLISAALAVSAISLPSAAFAQSAGSILVVDSDRIFADCTACKAATTQLQQQQASARTRAESLQQQIQTEGKPLQDAIEALNGKDPGPALKAKITAFQSRQKSAQQELENLQRNFDSTVANVKLQIGNKVIAIVEQVRASRRAAIVLNKNSTMANDSGIDITNEVLASLNQQLPAVTVAPLPQQQQQQPQGR